MLSIVFSYFYVPGRKRLVSFFVGEYVNLKNVHILFQIIFAAAYVFGWWPQVSISIWSRVM